MDIQVKTQSELLNLCQRRIKVLSNSSFKVVVFGDYFLVHVFPLSCVR